MQISNAPREPVNARDHENVALTQEVQDGPQFIASRRGGAAALLGSDDLAPGRAESSLLHPIEASRAQCMAGLQDPLGTLFGFCG